MSSLSESPEEEEVDASEAERSASNAAPSFSSSSSPASPPPADMLSTSPRKRTQTLPSLGGLPGFRPSREPSWERWSYLQETLDEKDEKTFSEDIFKILDLQKVTLFPERQNSNGRDEGKEAVQERRSSNGAIKPAELPQVKVEPQAKPKENLKQSSTSLSREEIVKEQPQSVNQKQGDNTTDQQQLITSLQQTNKELSATVVELQSALEAERRCKAALEILLRNAERNKNEALRRNEQLDREIQTFIGKSKPM